jgi:hypothetical protein
MRLTGQRSLRMAQKAALSAIEQNPDHKVFILLSAHKDPLSGKFDVDNLQYDVEDVSLA